MERPLSNSTGWRGGGERGRACGNTELRQYGQIEDFQYLVAAFDKRQVVLCVLGGGASPPPGVEAFGL